MRTLKLILVCFVCQVTLSQAQTSNLVIFTEQGERFYLILNGIRQNGSPETNVKVTGLSQPGYNAKVIFEDKSLGEVDKNVMLEPGMEVVGNVKRNKEGRFVLRYQSSAPIPYNPPPVQQQQVVTYSSTSVPLSTTTITTTTTTTNSVSDNANINLGMNGVGVNMNININDGMGGGQTTTTQTTTQSYTTTNSTANYPPAPQAAQGGCQGPMNPRDFDGAKGTISSKSFEDSKLQIAKQVISSNCMMASQVREIMLLFSFEDSRLTFAKYAYAFTFDRGNYFKVNDAFQFESSIDDLNNYIQSQGR